MSIGGGAQLALRPINRSLVTRHSLVEGGVWARDYRCMHDPGNRSCSNSVARNQQEFDSKKVGVEFRTGELDCDKIAMEQWAAECWNDPGLDSGSCFWRTAQVELFINPCEYLKKKIKLSDITGADITYFKNEFEQCIITSFKQRLKRSTINNRLHLIEEVANTWDAVFWDEDEEVFKVQELTGT